ncbi:MAG: RNA 3'-terminal phosphate cyclase [Candidatus Aenigmatarchaeota archaeon]
MILIDGGIGWGQVLRTAIALSSLTLKPVKVINIRKGRPRPGLMAQHATGIKIASEFCNAHVKGLKVGSLEVEFSPKKHHFENKKFINIGTAGSIALLLQTLSPLLIFADKEVELEIKGGTFGLGAPTIEYLKYIAFPILSKLGLKEPEIEIKQQGGYPKGGGLVKIKFFPVEKLSSVKLIERGKVKKIKGISLACNLPIDVAYRQANAAKNLLLKNYEEIEITPQVEKSLSPGTSITLWAECENSILGSDNIGKKGVRAENIGEEAAKELIKSIESEAALDKFMADQIIPFIALASGTSEIKVEEITEHCETNIRVCEQILGVKFEIDKNRKIISVDGVGFKE